MIQCLSHLYMSNDRIRIQRMVPKDYLSKPQGNGKKFPQSPSFSVYRITSPSASSRLTSFLTQRKKSVNHSFAFRSSFELFRQL